MLAGAILVRMLVLLLAGISGSAAGESAWGQFCDDNACSVNCGQSVSVDNPGCLNESGRQSLLLHGQNIQEVALVISPGPDCPCQSDCIGAILSGAAGAWYPDPSCIDLSSYQYAQSFRFIGAVSANSIDGYGICDPNNCDSPNSPGKYDSSQSSSGESYGKYDSGPSTAPYGSTYDNSGQDTSTYVASYDFSSDSSTYDSPSYDSSDDEATYDNSYTSDY